MWLYSPVKNKVLGKSNSFFIGHWPSRKNPQNQPFHQHCKRKILQSQYCRKKTYFCNLLFVHNSHALMIILYLFIISGKNSTQKWCLSKWLKAADQKQYSQVSQSYVQPHEQKWYAKPWEEHESRSSEQWWFQCSKTSSYHRNTVCSFHIFHQSSLYLGKNIKITLEKKRSVTFIWYLEQETACYLDGSSQTRSRSV